MQAHNFKQTLIHMDMFFYCVCIMSLKFEMQHLNPISSYCNDRSLKHMKKSSCLPPIMENLGFLCHLSQKNSPLEWFDVMY